MKENVSVFKVILLFIFEFIVFMICYSILYYLLMKIFNFLMGNINIFYAIFSKNIPYILFTLIYSSTLGKYAFLITSSLTLTISKNQENAKRSFFGVGIFLIIYAIISFVIYLTMSHISFDLAFIIGGLMFMALGKTETENITE